MNKSIGAVLGGAASIAGLIVLGYLLYDRYSDPTFEITFSQAPQVEGQADITLATGKTSVRNVQVYAMGYLVEIVNTSQKPLHINQVLLVPSPSKNGEVFAMAGNPSSGSEISPGQSREYILQLSSKKLKRLKADGVSTFSLDVYTPAGLAGQLNDMSHVFEHKVGGRYRGGEFKGASLSFEQLP